MQRTVRELMAKRKIEDQAITMLSIPEAANLLGVADVTVRAWLKQGRLPHYKLGARVLFKQADLIAFLESRRIPARSEVVAASQ